MVARGLPNKLIARELGISEKTVKAHLTSVFRTIGVTDRTQAALWAERHGLAVVGPKSDCALPHRAARSRCERAPHSRRAPPHGAARPRRARDGPRGRRGRGRRPRRALLQRAEHRAAAGPNAGRRRAAGRLHRPHRAARTAWSVVVVHERRIAWRGRPHRIRLGRFLAGGSRFRTGPAGTPSPSVRSARAARSAAPP